MELKLRFTRTFYNEYVGAIDLPTVLTEDHVCDFLLTYILSHTVSHISQSTGQIITFDMGSSLGNVASGNYLAVSYDAKHISIS